MLKINCVEDVEKFVRERPHHPLAVAWGDMLYDTAYGEQYTLDDFMYEANCQVADGNVDVYDVLVLEECHG